MTKVTYVGAHYVPMETPLICKNVLSLNLKVLNSSTIFRAFKIKSLDTSLGIHSGWLSSQTSIASLPRLLSIFVYIFVTSKVSSTLLSVVFFRTLFKKSMSSRT